MNEEPYSSVIITRHHEIHLESASPSGDLVIYRVDSADIQSTDIFGGTGYMGTTPGSETKQPSEFYILDTKLGTKTRIYCDRFLFWSVDSTIVTCANDTYNAADRTRSAFPYPALEGDYEFSLPAWDSSGQNLAFIKSGNISVYNLATDTVKRVETIGGFSSLEWLPGDQYLLAGGRGIYLIDLLNSTTKEILYTDNDVRSISWMP